MPPHRLAEPYEALRDASDAALARDGARPSVFLANLGPVVAFSARATFARSLFEAGGVEALGDDGFASAAEAAAAFTASGAALACLCSSDEIYATRRRADGASLRRPAPRRLSGGAAACDSEAALREAGVDYFLYAGGDALEALRLAYQSIGVVA